MKNKGILFVLFLSLFVANITNSQISSPVFAWAQAGSNTGSYAYSDGIKCDNLGNIYVTGRKAGTFILGGVTLSAGGGTPIFNGKLSAATGLASWVKNSYTSGGFDYPYGASIDNSGNVFSTGTSNSGSGAIFLSKTNNTTGAVMFNINLPTTGSGRATATDAAGNTYITGVSNGNINFGFGMLTAMGSSDIFLAKYNPSGVCLWAVKAGGAGFDQGNGLAVDPAGNVYMVGGYTGSATFGSFTLPAAGAYSNLFVAKYNPSGVCQWATSASNAGILLNSWWESNEITVDPCGNSYVAGHFRNTANFGSGISLTSAGGDDSFIAKFNNTGVCQWASSQGSAGADQGQSIAIDLDGDAYILGSYAGNLNFSNSSSISLPNVSNRNTFVAKYCNGNGALVWAQRISGSPSSYVDPGGITVDNGKNSYIIGHYSGNVVIGTSTLATSPGNTYIYTAKMNPGNNYTISPQFPSLLCSGNCYNVPFTAVGSFSTGNVFTAQLSDANGSFTAAVNVGSFASTSSGFINVCIPANTPAGTNYKLRLVSSLPAYSSPDLCNVTYTINVGPNINTTATPTSVCLQGQTTSTLTFSGGLSYTTQPGNFSTSTVIISPTVATIYTVTGTGSNGCIATKTIQIGINPSATATAASPSNCAGATLSLSATGGTSFAWTGPNGFTSSLQNPLIPFSNSSHNGQYTVVVTSSLGCTASTITTASITTIQSPTITHNAPAGICNGGTLHLNASAPVGSTYNWTGPNGYFSSVQSASLAPVSLLANGIYSVIATLNTCTSGATTSITVHSLPTPILVSNGPVCEPAPINFTATGGTSYTLTGPGGFYSNNSTSNIPFTWAYNSGLYTLTVSDAHNCVNTISSNVIINALPNVNILGSVICANQTATLSASGGTSYAWSGPANFTSSLSTVIMPNAQPSISGDYSVVVTSAFGCIRKATAHITVNTLPTALALINSPLCEGKDVKLNATSQQAIEYTWKGPNGITVTGQNPIMTNAQLNMSGTYTVIATDVNGCIGYNTATLQVNALPTGFITANKDKGCVPVCSSFSINSSSNLTTIHWNVNSTSYGNGASFSNCFANSGNYSVTATITDAKGCVNQTNKFNVEAYPIPVADFYIKNDSPVENEEIELVDASSPAGGVQITQWDWSFTKQKLNFSSEQNPKVIYETTGAYPIALVITNAYGCKDTMVKSTLVKEDFDVFVPNTFTPNGDGLNDVFAAKGRGIAKFEMKVYDRWGERVFTSNDITVGWAGNYQNRGTDLVEDGEYVWKINLVNVSGKSKELVGKIMIMK